MVSLFVVAINNIYKKHYKMKMKKKKEKILMKLVVEY